MNHTHQDAIEFDGNGWDIAWHSHHCVVTSLSSYYIRHVFGKLKIGKNHEGMQWVMYAGDYIFGEETRFCSSKSLTKYRRYYRRVQAQQEALEGMKRMLSTFKPIIQRVLPRDPASSYSGHIIIGPFPRN